jgi:predicted RNase H-like nuclease
MKYNIQFAGIDGCNAGWILVGGYRERISSKSPKSEKWEIGLFSNIKHIWKQYNDLNLVLIDIPIGLKEMGSEPRRCDKEARKYLGRRSSTIFPVPCRKAIYAKNYQEANEINRKLTGKGISKQSWNITPKIKEIDRFIRNHPLAREKLIESHPEVCFASLAHDNPLKFSKRSTDGIRQRKDLLISYSKSLKEFLKVSFKKYNKSDVKTDDLLDATILALAAKLGFKNLSFFPKVYEIDQKGIPMRITYPEFF